MIGQVQEDNGSNARGGVIGFMGRVVTGVRDFFVASWNYLKKSNATFSGLGDDLVASAQTDLLNLKGQLEQLWTIKDEDKKTAALYLAAVLGKFGYTFIVIGISLLASTSKLIGGALCLFLAGKWLNLASKLFNILSETFVQSLKLFKSFAGKFITNALELGSKIVKKLGHYAGRLANAVLDVLRAIGSYFSRAWRVILDFVAAAARTVWKGIKAIGRLAKNLVRNLGSAIMNCCKGICHLVWGAIKATAIVLKGAALSVAALFFETGIASSLSGLAKTLFILDESLAAGLGALMDGVYAGGNSFIKAAKSMFGYGVTTPEPTPAGEESDLSSSEEMETEFAASAAAVLDDSTYFSRAARDSMHHVNERVASAGNQLLRAYQAQKQSMLGSSWLDANASESPRAASRHRIAVRNF